MYDPVTNEKNQIDDNKRPITYHLTVIFILIGTFLTLIVLLQAKGTLTLFSIVLALWGGGLPVGFIGMFFDCYLSEYRQLNREEID